MHSVGQQGGTVPARPEGRFQVQQVARRPTRGSVPGRLRYGVEVRIAVAMRAVATVSGHVDRVLTKYILCGFSIFTHT